MLMLRLLTIFLLAGPPVASLQSEIPQALREARIIFVQNDFGKADVGKRFESELVKWGKFRIVRNKPDADIVLVLAKDNKDVVLTILPREGNSPIWTDRVPQSAAAEGRLVENLRRKLEFR